LQPQYAGHRPLQRSGAARLIAQYVGVLYNESSATKPLRAQICFGSKVRYICYCATAEAAARAYDAIARMIPNRKLNFPTTSSVAASGAERRDGADVFPSESDLLAAIAAVRQAQPPRGKIKYVGVYYDHNASLACPFKAQIWVGGKNKYLGHHATAEAAARAYDMVARTITGRKLNFPVASASTQAGLMQAAACAYAGVTTPSHPVPPIEQQVQPPSAPRSAPPQHDGGDDNGCSAAAEEPAHSRKRTRSDSFDAEHPAPQLRQHPRHP
jgi:hypothetical protein